MDVMNRPHRIDEQFGILSNYNVHIVDDVPDNWKCSICNSLLNNACFALCGCNFCSKCISNYLQNGDQICPGGTEKCSEISLNYHEDIIQDPLKNREISFITVECPLDSCSYQCKLRDLGAHLKVCSKSPLNSECHAACCYNDTVTEDSFEEVIDVCHGNQVKMLSKFVKNMEEDINKRIETIDDDLCDKLACKDSVVTNLTCRLNIVEMEQKMNVECTKRLDDENRILRIEAETLRTETRRIHVLNLCLLLLAGIAILAEFGCYDKVQTKTHSTFKMVLEPKEDAYEHQQDIGKKSDSIANLNASVLDLYSIIDGFYKMVDEIHVKVQKLNSTQNARTKKEDPFITEQNGFQWNVTDVRRKYECNEFSVSQPFYSDGKMKGYRMFIHYYMSKENGLFLTFAFLVGHYDYLLEWPMTRTVEMEILDHETQLPILSQAFSRAMSINGFDQDARKAAYNRPRNHYQAYSDGFLAYKSFNELWQIPGLIKNDTILVRCRVLSE